MMLPGADQAIIENRKLRDYLLNAEHPDNGGKAAFFAGWGFSGDDLSPLVFAIQEMVQGNPVAKAVQSNWGMKYVVDGTLASPKGVTPSVRTIWIVEPGTTAPRLVSAYPAPER